MSKPHWVDVYVGRRIRELRKEKRMSQTVLARAVSVTFQQIQKYEKAMNRVSCSMLVEICLALECQPTTLLPRLHMTGAMMDAIVKLPKVRAKAKTKPARELFGTEH